MANFYPHFDRIVETDCGKIRGAAGFDPRFTVYRGVPYAKPPVGALRWRRPQPMEPWEGVRDCIEFGAPGPQGMHEVGSLYGKEFFQQEEIRSEDCLYLNVWTPSMGGNEKLPVLFWIHGGALMAGYGSEPEFDGEAFCREGVIVVTCNYRLGVLGFYSNSELAAAEGTSGNYGHMDQIAAFHWVRRNIAAFGGDPDRITVAGQSSGAVSAQILAASPLTQGEIAGCIIMSSSGVTKPGEYGSFAHRCMPMAEAIALGDELLRDSGCANTDELRKLSYEELMALPGMVMDLPNGIFPKFSAGPVLDGYVLDERATAKAYLGTLPDIPFMVGNTAGEGGMMGRYAGLERWKQTVTAQHGEGFLQQFPVETEDDAKAIIAQMHDGMSGNRAFCQCLNRAGKKAPYLYIFDHDLPGNNDGSFHSGELWYVFGTFTRSWRPMTGVDFDISRTMTKAWANFVKNGDPNGAGVPVWLPYTANAQYNMVFSEQSACVPVEPSPVQEYIIANLIS